jgi:hypothetical protein
MGGGLMQLVASGAQDLYLVGDPQITFFKGVYRRHTNFSMESISQILDGHTKFGSRVSATISRNGDLIQQIYIEVPIIIKPGSEPDFTNTYKLTNIQNQKVGLLLIREVEIIIGGQRIDKHYSQWLDIWSELTLPIGHRKGFKKMTETRDLISDDTVGTSINHKLYIPLQFWFCRNPGLALPLIALQYHEVKIYIQFEEKSLLLGSSNVSGTNNTITGVITDIDDISENDVKQSVNLLGTNSDNIESENEIFPKLWINYIYLDTDERRKFAQLSHEYLIEQLQFTGIDYTNNQGHRLNLNHPVKEIIWVEKSSTSSEIFSYNKSTIAKLLLNGQNRFIERKGEYFTLVQPYQHHSNIPLSNIQVYSFALNPEDNQPSGSCNMSRIDNIKLNVVPNVNSDIIYIYAINYNVLRVMGGMGGLAFSN